MRKLAFTLAVTMSAIGVVAVHLWNELRAEHQKLAGQQAQFSGLENAQRVASAGPAVREELPAAEATGSMEQQQAPDEDAAGVSKRVIASLQSNPVIASPGGPPRQLTRRYPDLAKDLGLTPAKADEFLDVLARQQADSMGDSKNPSLVGKSSEEKQQFYADQRAARQQELADMLGGEHSRWSEYQGTVTAREQVAQMGTLLTGDNALTAAQSGPLIAAMGPEIARFGEEYQNRPRPGAASVQAADQGALGYLTGRNQRMVSAASAHLTPAQLASYKKMLEQEENSYRASLEASSKSGKAQGQGGAAP